jgi:HEAT repeat protein
MGGTVAVLILIVTLFCLPDEFSGLSGLEKQAARVMRDIRAEERRTNPTGLFRLVYELPGPVSFLQDWLFPGTMQGDYYYQEQLVKLGTNIGPYLEQKLISDHSPAVRKLSASALGELGIVAAVPRLTNVLALDTEGEVRATAATSLGQLRETDAVSPLLNALRSDAEESVTTAAADALGQLGDRRALPTLLELLGQPERTDSKIAKVRAVGRLGDSNSLPVLESLLKPNSPLVLTNPGPNSWFTIYSADNFRSEVVDAIGNVGGAAAGPVLLAHLGVGNDALFEEAVCRVLGQIGERRAVPVLVKALDGDPRVAVAAATALGDIGDPQVAPQLMSLLTAPNDELRAAAARGLGLIEHAPAATALRELIQNDADEKVRAEACVSLALVGDASVASEIAAALPRLRDERKEVVWILGHIGGQECVPVLVECLTDRDREVRFAAAYGLAAIGGEAAVAALLTRQTDEDEFARHAKATALLMLGRNESLGEVRASLRAGEAWRRFGAGLALMRAGTNATPADFASLQQDRVPALRQFAAGVVAGRGTMTLADLLQHPEREYRQYAARALAFCRDPATLPALQRACSDPDATVRQAARWTVRRLQR